ncbi:helix-turn-helix domain-containing protein [Amycolatopsis sp. NPDC058340]|uniref:helix-turn-helix domain-containing protein n=1 Tax=Amycolatopsis sp. NPDC058340 TaxID=3346453 RepID=UPI00364C827E
MRHQRLPRPQPVRLRTTPRPLARRAEQPDQNCRCAAVCPGHEQRTRNRDGARPPAPRVPVRARPHHPQFGAFTQHVGTARWAYNHALAQKFDALQRRQLQIDELVTLGYSEHQARTEAVKIPATPNIQKR